jgi:hypothetical protein
MLTKSKIALSVALILATASAAMAAGGPAPGQNGYDAALRQCVRTLQTSGGSVGSPGEDSGVTEYDVMVWHCESEMYRAHASAPQPRQARTAKRRR